MQVNFRSAQRRFGHCAIRLSNEDGALFNVAKRQIWLSQERLAPRVRRPLFAIALAPKLSRQNSLLVLIAK